MPGPWCRSARTPLFPADRSSEAPCSEIHIVYCLRPIALLHQHQREVKVVEHRGERVRYIEVTAWDLAMADR